MMIFDGGIQIYKMGEILVDQEVREKRGPVEGLHLVVNGRIWFAEKPKSHQLNGGSLYEAIFGKTSTDIGMIRKINAIIRGYEYQKEAIREAKRKRRSDELRSSRVHAEEAAFGTFGHGHFTGR